MIRISVNALAASIPNRLFAAIAASALASTLLAGSALAQDDIGFSSLEERMTAAEFRAAGLDKLSDEELAALNRWIRARSLAEEEAIALLEQQQRQQGPAPMSQMPLEPFEARIVGEFSGWSGGTEFVLDNGMVWKQTGNDRYTTAPMDNPQVTLRPALLGNWTLQVEGYNKRTSVERIR